MSREKLFSNCCMLSVVLKKSTFVVCCLCSFEGLLCCCLVIHIEGLGEDGTARRHVHSTGVPLECSLALQPAETL